MTVFKEFLKIKRSSVLLFALLMVILCVTAYLYSLTAEAVIYTAVLWAVAVTAVFTAEFLKFRKKSIQLDKIKRNLPAMREYMPEPSDAVEKSYNEIALSLLEEKNRVEAREAAKLKDLNDYYTMWVHQIKTPISAMNLLLQQKPDGEMSEQLMKIEQYVEMALTYVRCGDDASDFVIKNTSLDCVVKSSVRKFAKSFVRKKIKLNYTETGLKVLTDEKWLSFVIEQLLSNSLKYTKEGSISIYSESGRKLIIEDTGIGIAAEDLPRVCEKGYTGYNGRQEKKSTGIGLFLSKKVLDMLGHKMVIESEAGKGTRVTIIFSNPHIKYE